MMYWTGSSKEPLSSKLLHFSTEDLSPVEGDTPLRYTYSVGKKVSFFLTHQVTHGP